MRGNERGFALAAEVLVLRVLVAVPAPNISRRCLSPMNYHVATQMNTQTAITNAMIRNIEMRSTSLSNLSSRGVSFG